jgi:hypothetical protein
MTHHPADIGAAFEGTTFLTDLKGRNRQSSDEEKLEFNASQLRPYCPYAFSLWSDGSVKANKDPHAVSPPAMNGSSAALLRRTSIEDDKVVFQAARPLWCCSYSTERTALLGGLEEVVARPDVRPLVLPVVSDSLSTLSALQKGPFLAADEELARIWSAVITLWLQGTTVVFIFVFSHVGTNEEVDEAADVAMAAPAYPRVWAPDEARHHKVRAAVKYDATADLGAFRSKHRRQPSNLNDWRVKGMLRSSHRRLLALRVGCCADIGGYKHGQKDPCPVCGEVVMDRGGVAVEHLFSCTHPRAVAARQQWGVADPSSLWAAPKRAIGYVNTLLGK